MNDPASTFELPPELSDILTAAGRARVKDEILRMHARLLRESAARSTGEKPRLGRDLQEIFDIVARALYGRLDFSDLLEDYIPTMVYKIHDVLGWYPVCNLEVMKDHYLAGPITDWRTKTGEGSKSQAWEKNDVGGKPAETVAQLATISGPEHQRLAKAERKLKDALRSHEMMREFFEPGEWRVVGKSYTGQEKIGAIRRLERDLKNYMVALLELRLGGALDLATAGDASDPMEGVIRGILNETVARVAERDRPLLDLASLERDLRSRAGYLVGRATPGHPANPYQEFPKWKRHWTKDPILVKSADEELALGPGWADSRSEFDEFRKRPAPTHEANPILWVDEWSVAGLQENHSNTIKAKVLSAHAAFCRSASGFPSAALEAMRLAFGGIADALFQARLLRPELLETEIPVLVWDCAVSGGWWPLASAERRNIFREKIGHYWIWYDDPPHWQGIFDAERAEWTSKLLLASTRQRKSFVEPSPASSRQWSDLTITFTSDERITIRWPGTEPETRNYGEMGFADGRGGKPRAAWEALRELSGTEQPMRIEKKRAQEIRQLLGKHFGIGSDPLLFKKGLGYIPRFQLGRSASFDS